MPKKIRLRLQLNTDSAPAIYMCDILDESHITCLVIINIVDGITKYIKMPYSNILWFSYEEETDI